MPNSLIKKYKSTLKANGWQEDNQQLLAVTSLQRLSNDFKSEDGFKLWPFSKKNYPIQGVYLYGGVGRGKSMLMDLFFDYTAKNMLKRRIHFHEFMIETHDWLHKKRGERVDDLMPRYAQYVSKSVDLLCFDEFHVTDVADAMLLGRLFSALLEEGVVIVATSNWAPDDLYEGGLQRELFLPFILLLKRRMEVVHLDSESDYRKMADPDQDVYYFYPLSAATKARADQLFIDYAEGMPIEADEIIVKKRIIAVKESANGAAKFSFADLCEKPHGAEDFIAIARRYHTVFITDIPKLTYDRRNEVKRLILLIDCLYEEGCRVVITADAPVDMLYQDGNHAFEFDRTVSRLIEMQSAGYHEEAVEKRASL